MYIISRYLLFISNQSYEQLEWEDTVELQIIRMAYLTVKGEGYFFKPMERQGTFL